MTTATAVAYTYVGLPVSSGGSHGLGTMKRAVAVEQVRKFLEICTVPSGPAEEWISEVPVPALRVPRRLRKEMKRHFGSSIRARTTAEQALTFLDAVDPQPTNQWGMAPIWFRSSTKFQIVDPQNGSVLPSQSPDAYKGVEYEWSVPLGISQTRLRLDNRAHLGIELCIPNCDPEVLPRVVPWLQDHLPMKLSTKHWRAWYPTKSGSLVARKIDAPTR